MLGPRRFLFIFTIPVQSRHPLGIILGILTKAWSLGFCSQYLPNSEAPGQKRILLYGVSVLSRPNLLRTSQPLSYIFALSDMSKFSSSLNRQLSSSYTLSYYSNVRRRVGPVQSSRTGRCCGNLRDSALTFKDIDSDSERTMITGSTTAAPVSLARRADGQTVVISHDPVLPPDF